jgi:hypothetical protein
MSHFIKGIIACSETADAVCKELQALRAVSLHEGFAFIPINAEESSPDECFAGFRSLTAEFHESLKRLSRLGRFAYIETEYWAGDGCQGAVVYDKNEVLLTPECADYRPINKALRLCGVVNARSKDEFDTVGLGHHRDNDDWLSGREYGRR